MQTINTSLISISEQSTFLINNCEINKGNHINSSCLIKSQFSNLIEIHNSTFNSVNLLDSFYFDIIDTPLFIFNLKIINSKLDCINDNSCYSINSFFKLNSILMIDGLFIDSNILYNASVFYYDNQTQTNSLTISIKNSIFVNNLGYFETAIFININNPLILLFTLEDCYFNQNIAQHRLIEITNIKKLLINESKFIDNLCDNIFLLKNITILKISNLLFLNNNQMNNFSNFYLLYQTYDKNFSKNKVQKTGNIINIKDGFNIDISYINLINCVGYTDIPGIYILKESKEYINFTLIHSVFKNNLAQNMVDYNMFGTVFSLNELNQAYIFNCTFQNNTSIFISKSVVGGPAIFFSSTFGILLISKCFFIGNKAFRSSNVIEFDGSNLTIKDSYFYGNKQKNSSFAEFSVGCINSKVSYLFMYDTIFEENLAQKGMIFLKEKPYFSQIYGKNLTFIKNLAMTVASIYLDELAQNRSLFIEDSNFQSNYADQYSAILYIYITSKIIFHNITFFNCKFVNNTSFSGTIACLWIYSSNSFTNFISSIFLGNIASFDYGIGLYSTFGIEKTLYLNFSKCFYENNSARLGGIHYLFDALLTDYDSIYINTYAVEDGGIIHSVSEGNIIMKNIIFVNSVSNLGSIIYSRDQSNIDLNNITIINCFSNTGIFHFTTFVIVFMKNIILINNNVNYGGLINFKNNGFENLQILEDLTIYNITSTLILTQNTFISIENLNIQFFNKILLEISYSKFKLSNSSINNGTCNESKGCVLKSTISESIFDYINISNINCLKCNGIYYIEGKSLEIYNSYFFNNFNNNENGVFYSIGSLLKFSKIICKNFVSNIIFLLDGKINFTLLIIYNIIENNMKNSAIYCKNCEDFYLLNCSFLNLNSSVFGTAIYINDYKYINTEFKIINCLFLNINSTDMGGSIYIQESYISIESTIFFKNSALRGGAIYFYCELFDDENKNCLLNLKNNYFIKNSAIIDGAGLKWLYNKPNNIKNIFYDNNASYGSDISSFPIKLGLKTYKKNTVISSKKKEIGDAEDTSKAYNRSNPNFVNYLNKSFLILENEVSGFSISCVFEIEILDVYNQVILENIYDKIELSMLDDFDYFKNEESIQKFKNKLDIITYNISRLAISGRTTNLQDSITYTYIFDQIIIDATPTSLQYLKISSSYFKKLNINQINKLTEKLPNEYKIDEEFNIIIPIFFRHCFIGEIYQENKCTICEDGTYSIDIKSNCSICPENSYCTDGFKIDIESGYWRAHVNSLKIYKCSKIIGACLGGYYSNCSDHYEGNLCSSCKKENNNYYQRGFNGICVMCLNIGIIILIYAIIVCFAIFTLEFFYRLFYDDSDKNKNKKIFVKILFNYVQYFFIIQNYDKSLLALINSGNFNFKIGKIWFFFDCLVLNIFDELNVFYINFLVNLLCLLTFIIWLSCPLFYGFKKNKTKISIKILYKLKNFKSFLDIIKIKEKIILFYYIFGIFYLDLAVSYVFCTEINNQFYVINLPQQNCSNKEYSIWLYSIFLPIIILMKIVIPFFIGKYLYPLNNFSFKKMISTYKSGHFLTSLSSIKKIFGNKKIKTPTSVSAFQSKSTIEIKNEYKMFLFSYKSNPFIWENLDLFMKFLLIIINQSDLIKEVKLMLTIYLLIYRLIFFFTFMPLKETIFNFLDLSMTFNLFIISFTIFWNIIGMDNEQQGIAYFNLIFSFLFFLIFVLITCLRNVKIAKRLGWYFWRILLRCFKH